MKLHKFLIAVVAFTLSLSFANCQELTKLWTGLRTPQPESEKPHGKVPFQIAKRVDKKTIPLTLQPVDNNTWVIKDSWEMTEGKTVIESPVSIFSEDFCTDDKWYNAVVPGTVLTTLVKNGIYPDPYFGLNNMAIPESLCRQEWWYRTPLEIPDEVKGDDVHIVFEGINYKAEVYLNGHFVGQILGAFNRGDFDVTNFIKDKGNVLAVHIYPPFNPGIPHEQSMIAGQGLNGGALSLDGPTFISSIGWDWVPGIRDRNIGIWQDVKLEAYKKVQIADMLIKTDLPIPDTSYAELSVSVDINNLSDMPQNGNLQLECRSIKLNIPYSIKANSSENINLDAEKYPELRISNPELWWPNGYGKQSLYEMKLTAFNEKGSVSDVASTTFGIREMSYELMASDGNLNKRYLYTPNDCKQAGNPLFDYVNRKIYKEPINIPVLNSDADRLSLKELDSNDPMGPYLVIRVNGKRIFCRGGNWGMDDAMKNTSIEHLEPYFMLHKDANFNIVRNWTGESTEENFYALCDKYGMLVWNDFWITTDDTVEPNDVDLFIKNAKDVVRRYRNHPSIAIWCPRNEGYAPDDMAVELQKMVVSEDPTRHYHGQSRFLNMDSSGPWGFFKDPSVYYTTNAKGFLTEIGTFAIPTSNTLRKFIAPEDLWPINDVWAYHDLHHLSQNFTDFIAEVESYGKPSGVDDFAKKAQLVCYDSWRSIMEAWGSKMWNNTSGQILWMSHPAWPSMIWQTYTYDYETPGSFFGVKKACEPLHAQLNLPNQKVVCVNTTLNNVSNAGVEVSYYDIHAKKIYSKSVKTDLKANSRVELFTPATDNLPEIYLARVILRDSKGKELSLNDYWITDNKENRRLINDIGKAEISVTVKKGCVEFVNKSSNIAVSVKPTAYDENGNQILPALFSEGYFNLLPNQKRVISLDTPYYKGKITVKADGYNL